MTESTALTLDGQDLTVGALIEHVAQVIARSRYEAWDSHAQGAFPLTWEEYLAVDPAVAGGIYLEDGRRDARALFPSLMLMLRQTAVNALRESIDRYQAATPAQHVLVEEYAALSDADSVLAWLRVLAAGAIPTDDRASDPAPLEGTHDHDHAHRT